MVMLIGGIAWSGGAHYSQAADSSRRSAANKVPDFYLSDHQGKSYGLYRQEKAKAIVLIFTSTGCPIVQKSIPQIKALRDQFEAKGVVFWLVDSNTEDDAASVRDEARDFEIDLPILLDRTQTVARSLDAKRTAEAICIKPGSWTIFYRGAIDDHLEYGTEKARTNHPYLENALSNFLAGKKVSPSRTEVKGCRIQFEVSGADKK
jgi:peroxiredoxin